jgi:DNA replication and repair protein RecF
MTLQRIEVTDFRCLHAAEVEFDPRFTLISGPNASGKTSLLEAIYVLGRGRSFRTRRLDNLIRSGAERFVIFGEVTSSEQRIGLGIEGSAQGMRAKLAGDRVASLVELAAVLPVTIIDPEVHRLIDEGPSRRRRFLDWGVFHVEHDFVDKWQLFQQVLKQRNAALKSHQKPPLIAAWDGEFIRLGSAVHEARARYMALLAPIANEIVRRLLGLDLSMSYRSGWLREQDLGEALRGTFPQDQESGFTQVGPQRADIVLRLDGLPVKDRISRGQQKLLATSLLLAQLRLFSGENALQPTLLLDDPAAELDSARLLSLISEVTAQAVQLIVTSLRADFDMLGTPGCRYRIDGGSVSGG